MAGAAAARADRGPLDGCRVLDLSRVLAGPLCGQLLADYGADVIKVEPPQGDETRSWGPPFVAEEQSAYFTGLNRNKQNICLNLKSERGREILVKLISAADVVIENFLPGTMARWQLGYEDVLAPRFPRLIYCRTSGFGSTGPLGRMPGYDAVLQAFAGLMSVTGEPDGEPTRIGVPLVDLHTASQLFSGVLLALLERGVSGLGQLVECTLLDSAINLLHPHSATWLATGDVPVRSGSAHAVIAPYEAFDADNGLLFLAAGNDRQFATLVSALGRPELAEDSRFVDNTSRLRNRKELRAELEVLLQSADREQLTVDLLRRGIPAAPVHDVAQAMTNGQVSHRGLVIEVPGYRGVAAPIQLSRTPAQFQSAPRRKGADTVAILRGLGYDADAIDDLLHGGAAIASDG
jgi:crotonobetainyl-CoA:carnitine CoA-transferase CaiB-like acyl-CoA transferase